MKNKLLYGIIFLIIIVVIVLVSNKVFASMADYTDEQAYDDYLKEQSEWNETHKDSINKSSNNYLKSISIENYEISPSFERQTVDYSLTKDVDSDTINIKAEAEDEKASVSGTGIIKLNSGENNLKIDVTAENGTVRTYSINVNKKEDGESQENNVENNRENNIENSIEKGTNNEFNNKKIIFATICVIIIIMLIIIISNKKRYKRKH